MPAYPRRYRRAVTVALPCNSYRDAEHRQECKLPTIQAYALGMDIARTMDAGIGLNLSLCCFTPPRSSRWHNRKVQARRPAHPLPGRNACAEPGTPARRVTVPDSNAPETQQPRRARRGIAARLPRGTNRLRVAPRANTMLRPGQPRRAAAKNRVAAAPSRALTRKRMLVRSDPVARAMCLSATTTKARKVRRGERRPRMIPRFGGDLHAPRPPAPPRPGTDPHEHPTDPPVEVPIEPRPPHPGSDPVEVPTEPRPEHPSRRMSDATAGSRARTVRHDR